MSKKEKKGNKKSNKKTIYIFSVKVLRMTEIKVFEGKPCHIVWHRGNTGKTKEVAIKNQEALFDCSFQFKATIESTPENVFLKKKLVMEFCVALPKKGTTISQCIGSAQIDVAQYVGIPNTINVPFVDGTKKIGNLEICVISTLQENAINPIIQSQFFDDVSQVSENTEQSYQEGEMTLPELLKERDDLAFELDELQQNVEALVNEIDEIEQEIVKIEDEQPQMRLGEDYLLPNSYNFLINKVMLATEMEYDNDKPKMAQIIFNRILHGDETKNSVGEDQMTDEEVTLLYVDEEEEDTYDEPFIDQLFAIINGTVQLSSGSPDRLSYWFSTILRIYALLETSLFNRKRTNIYKKCLVHLEKIIPTVLTTLMDYSISKTEYMLASYFVDMKRQQPAEKIFDPIKRLLNEMQWNYIDIMFRQEYIQLYLKYLDKYLCAKILPDVRSISIDLLKHIEGKIAKLKSFFPSELEITECFQLSTKLMKTLQINLENIPPEDVYMQFNGIISQHSMFELIKKMNPPLKEKVLLKYQQALPERPGTNNIDPYAQIVVDRRTFDKFVLKQN